jgi:hypothetical protein
MGFSAQGQAGIHGSDTCERHCRNRGGLDLLLGTGMVPAPLRPGMWSSVCRGSHPRRLKPQSPPSVWPNTLLFPSTSIRRACVHVILGVGDSDEQWASTRLHPQVHSATRLSTWFFSPSAHALCSPGARTSYLYLRYPFPPEAERLFWVKGQQSLGHGSSKAQGWRRK